MDTLDRVARYDVQAPAAPKRQLWGASSLLLKWLGQNERVECGSSKPFAAQA